MLNFIKIIKDKQKSKGMSTAELARRAKLGCTQTLYNYLEGRTVVGADVVEKVLTVLGIKVQ